MYFTIGLILATASFILIMGPLFVYFIDKQRADETPPLKQSKNYFQAFIWIAEEDTDYIKAALGLATVLAFLCILVWPLFVLFALVIATLYFMSVNKIVRDTTKIVMNNIQDGINEYGKEEKN